MHVRETSLSILSATFLKAISVPISGLVVTFASPVENHADAIGLLGQIAEIDLGQVSGSKIAIVVDTETKGRDQEIWNAVRDLPGVVDLAVAMVAFDEEQETGDDAEPGRRRDAERK